MSNFLRNIMKLISGSIISQVFAILLFPVISRLYSPDNFGVFQIFISISSIITIIACFTYHLAIMLPKKNEDSVNIVVLCIILLSISSILSGVIFIPMSHEIAIFLNIPCLEKYLKLLPIAVFLSSLFTVLNYWSSRRVRFGIVAKANVSNVLSCKLSQVGIGIYSPSPLGLLAGYIIGFLLADSLMLSYLRSDISYFKKVSKNKMGMLARRYSRFPKFSMWSLLINTSSFQLVPFMFAYFFVPETVGYYSFANQILTLPVSLVGAATSQVFFQKASEVKNNNGNFEKVVGEVHRKLILFGVFPLVVFIIISEDLFSLFLGNVWYTAGIYAKILAPMIFIRFIYSPISTVFDILEKQHIELIFNIVMIISIFTAIFIGGTYGDPLFSLMLLSFFGVILYGIGNFYLLKISKISLMFEIKFLIKHLSLAILISIPLIVAKYFYFSIYLILLFSGILTIVYYYMVIGKDEKLKNELSGFLSLYKK